MQCHWTFKSIAQLSKAHASFYGVKYGVKKEHQFERQKRLSAREGLTHATTQKKNFSMRFALPTTQEQTLTIWISAFDITPSQFLSKTLIKHIRVRICCPELESEFCKKLRRNCLYHQRANLATKRLGFAQVAEVQWHQRTIPVLARGIMQALFGC